MVALTSNSRSLPAPDRFTTVLQAFVAESGAFLRAVANPREAIREVEAMRLLLNQAHRVEATDPQHAAALRKQASLIGLR